MLRVSPHLTLSEVNSPQICLKKYQTLYNCINIDYEIIFAINIKLSFLKSWTLPLQYYCPSKSAGQLGAVL